MKAKKRKGFLLIIILVLVVLAAAAVYFFEFNQYGYIMTVPYRSSFTEIADHIYINKGNKWSQEEILDLIKQAEERDRVFWGDLHYLDETIFIICDDEKLIRKIGEDHATVTISFPFERHYICISDKYLELDILAHEINHAELRSRLTSGAQAKIPTWFDEGLALQNDYREIYSEEQWISQTDNGKNVIAPEDMDTPAEFYAGEVKDRRFRYLNAKHELNVWLAIHGQQGLLELIDKLNGGEDFDMAYGR